MWPAWYDKASGEVSGAQTSKQGDLWDNHSGLEKTQRVTNRDLLAENRWWLGSETDLKGAYMADLSPEMWQLRRTASACVPISSSMMFYHGIIDTQYIIYMHINYMIFMDKS